MAILTGKAYWSFITTPNTRFTPVYSINLVVDDETAAQFEADGFKVKDTEEGKTLVIKRDVENKQGVKMQPPKLYDRSMREVDIAIGNGSTVKVDYRPWEATWKGKVFKGLDLRAVQIVDLIEYGGSEEGLTPIDSNLEDSYI